MRPLDFARHVSGALQGADGLPPRRIGDCRRMPELLSALRHPKGPTKGGREAAIHRTRAALNRSRKPSRDAAFGNAGASSGP